MNRLALPYSAPLLTLPVRAWPQHREYEALAVAAAWTALQAMDPAARAAILRERGWASAALLERVLTEADATGWRDPHRRLALARLAVTIADQIQITEARSGEHALRVGALAHLADALRRMGDFAGALRVLAQARDALEPMPVALRARLLRIEGAVYRSAGHPDAAEALLGRASELFRQTKEPQEEAHALYLLALATGPLAPTQGIEHARQALALVSPLNPALGLAVRHTLTGFLLEAGDLPAALSLALETRPLAAQLGETELLQQSSLEGRLLLALGDGESAYVLLRSLLRPLRRAGLNRDLTQVMLELLALLVHQGKTRQATRRVRCHAALLRASKADPEVQAAWAELDPWGNAASVQARLRQLALLVRVSWRQVPLPPPSIWDEKPSARPPG
ncbi:MAG: hypothetical protein M3O15_03885 [Acidobacteriota bacterium]|nr:hypothetical protein [Acidobacteriota bacterium]